MTAEPHATPRRKPSVRQVRARLEAALDRLLDAVQATVDELDALDPESDLEESDVEPSLGVLERHPNYHLCNRQSPYLDQANWAIGASADDREEDCEDEGGACEDEGANSGDYEPDHDHESCHWQDEGDQATLVPHRVYSLRPETARSPHANVGELVPVSVRP